MPELRRTTNDDFLAKLLESLASDRKEEFCDWVMKTVNFRLYLIARISTDNINS